VTQELVWRGRRGERRYARVRDAVYMNANGTFGEDGREEEGTERDEVRRYEAQTYASAICREIVQRSP